MSAFTITWTLAASLGLLYVGVGVLHTLLDRRRQNHEERFRQDLAARIADPTGDQAKHLVVKRRWLTREPRMLQELAMALTGEGVLQIRDEAAKAGVSDRIRRLSRHRSWRARTRAAQFLRLLPDDDPAVARLLDDERSDVRARALDSIGVDAVALHGPLVIEACTSPDPATRFAAQQALLDADQRVVEPFLETIDIAGRGGYGPEAVSSILGSAAAMLDIDAVEAVARHSWNDTAEHRRLRVAVLATGLSVGAERELIDMFDDDQPTVRSAAVEAVGRLRNPLSAAAVARCLQDPSWDVRQAAGLALSSLGPAGLLMLRRALAGSDNFARDMAREMLDRQALGSGWTE